VARRYREIQLIPGHDAELTAHLRRQASTDLTTQLDEVLRRAQDRGEIDLDRLSPRIAHLPIDLVHHQIFVTRTPVSREIVDDAFLPLVTHHTTPRSPRA
jgi:hypothetical protein